MKNDKSLIDVYVGRINRYRPLFTIDCRLNGNNYHEIFELFKKEKLTYVRTSYTVATGSLVERETFFLSEPPISYKYEDGAIDRCFRPSYHLLGFSDRGSHDVIFFLETIDYIRGLGTKDVELPERFAYYPATAEELVSLIDDGSKNEIDIERRLKVSRGKRRYIAALGSIFRVLDKKNNEWSFFLMWDRIKKCFVLRCISQHWTSPAKCSDYLFLVRKLNY